MNKFLKPLLFAGLLIPGIGVTYYAHVGKTDRQAAEKHLERKDYDIVEYLGAPKFEGRGEGEIYADKFRVVSRDNRMDTLTVIVASGPVVGRSIHYMD